MSLQQQVTWKGIIVITLTVLLIPLAGLGADLDEDMIKAAYRGDITMVKDCLAKGADINAKMEDSGWTALMLAASEGHVDLLNFCLA
jgi:ankyrin repeat protein